MNLKLDSKLALVIGSTNLWISLKGFNLTPSKYVDQARTTEALLK